MKTVVLTEPGSLELVDRPPPGPLQAGEARVRVRRIGICGTDLHAYQGDQPFFTYPRVLGHELGVEVVEVHGDQSAISVGDYCTVEPYLHCGSCKPCLQGRTNCCTELIVLGVHQDGGMCEEMVVPINKLHSSSTLPLEHLALVEPLCIGAHAVARAGLTARDHVAVIGAGPIGLATAQFVSLAGAEPVIVEVNEHRLDFCEQFLGVKAGIDAREGIGEQLQEAFQGNLPDVVFDATGSAASMNAAFEQVASGGTLIFVGLVQHDITFNDPEFHRKEMTLLSSRNATCDDFRYVIAMLEEGRINLTPWITHRASLDEAVDVLGEWANPKNQVVKAIVDVN